MPDLAGRKIAFDVTDSTVVIEIECNSEYEARVLYDDFVERMKSGDGFSFSTRPNLSAGIETI